MEPIKKFEWSDLNIEAYNTLFAQLTERDLSCIYKYYSYNSREGEKEHIALVFKEEDLYGIKIDGHVVVPAYYDSITIIVERNYNGLLAIVGKKDSVGNNKYGILNENNKVIEEIGYDNIDYHLGTMYSVHFKLQKEGWYYYRNIGDIYPDGDRICIRSKEEYDNVVTYYTIYYSGIFESEIKKHFNRLPSSYAIVKKDGRIGMIWNDGSEIISLGLFGGIEPFELKFEKGHYSKEEFDVSKTELRAKVNFKNNKFREGWINPAGLIFGCIIPKYKAVRMLTEDRFLCVKKDGKYGIIDKNNLLIVDFIYNDCKGPRLVGGREIFSDQYVILHNDKGWVIVNVEKGDECTNYYDEIYWHEDIEHCYAKKNDKWGFINSIGEHVIPCIYDRLERIIWMDGVCSDCVIFNGQIGRIIKCEFIPTITIDSSENSDKHYYRGPSNWERPTYERYSGSYAQDEMGYSDNDIDTLFDGDPSAYWNID